jgi:hypothetical protein
MKTFSQAPTETNQLGDIINVLNILPDNTTKLISPKDVRDAVYTLWENTMFKPTSFTGSSVDYIGIDQYQLTDDNEVNWYPKMYFGKKQTGGQIIMNNNLLGQTDVDFFFYNTKNNSTLGNYETSIAILSGTGSFYNTTQNEVRSPQIVSTPVGNVDGQYMDLTIKNTSYNNDGTNDYGGNINITSEKGYVSINNFFFPSVKTITDNLSNYSGYILSFEVANGQAFGVWRSPFSQSISNITTDDAFTINAPSITLNGYKFTDSTIVATGIGGIRAGENFSSGVDVLDMIRRIVYTYVAPRVTSLLTTTTDQFTQVKLIENADKGTWDSLRLRASVIKNATQSITSLGYLLNPQLPSLIGSPAFPSVESIGNVTTTAIYQLNPSFDFDVIGNDRYKILTFTLSVTDNYPTTNVASSTIKTVLPYFYGTATYAATQSSGNSNINNILGMNINAPVGKLKPYLVEPIIGNPTFSDNQYLKITTRGLPDTTGEGKGFIYFGFPAGNPLLKFIYSDSNQNITSTFQTYSITGVNSPNTPSRWQNREYIFYILGETQVPLSAGTFSFIFT